MDKRKNEGAYAAAAAASLAMTHFHVPTDSIVSTAASITKNMGSLVYPTLPIEVYATANRALAETFSRYDRQQIVQNKTLLFNPAVENLMRDTVEAARASTINSFRAMQSYAERRNVVLRPNWSSSTATLLSSNHLGGTLDFLSDTSTIGRNQHQNQNDGQAKPPHTRHPRYKIVRRDVAHDSQKRSRKRKRHSRGPAEDETVNYDIFQQDNSLSWKKAVEIAADIITIMVYFGVTPSYIQQVMNALLVNLAKLMK